MRDKGLNTKTSLLRARRRHHRSGDRDRNGDGSGNGNGGGNGNGDGDGSGNGDGNGSGDRNRDGHRDGFGAGFFRDSQPESPAKPRFRRSSADRAIQVSVENCRIILYYQTVMHSGMRTNYVRLYSSPRHGHRAYFRIGR